MTKQEFAIKLLFFLMPYPMSRALPRILRRLLRGPSASTPGLWAQAAFSALSQLFSDVVSYARSLLFYIVDLRPTDQLTQLEAALRVSIESARLLVSTLSDITSSLGAYTTDEIIQAFLDAAASIDEISLAADSLYDVIPEPPIPAPPPYIAPFPPLYLGPPVPGPTGPSSPPHSIPVVTPPWFYDAFDTIDPAFWTDWSEGTGVTGIVGAKLKMLSNNAGDYAYLTTAPDTTIPAAFTWTFELKVSSGTGELVLVSRTGIHHIYAFFDPPNLLKFRQKLPLTYKYIDVGNFLGLTYTWKFVYNGTTCDIYRDGDLIASALTIYEHAGSKGQLSLSCDNVLTVYLDDYTITPA